MIEAISCGIPVISTNTGILTEFKKKEYYIYPQYTFYELILFNKKICEG